MQPIISPFFIYFLSTVNTLIGIFVAIAVISGASVLAWAIMRAWNWLEEVKIDDDEKESRYKQWSRRSLWVFIPFLLLSVFMPTKEALIGMFVVDKITPNNIEKALEAGNDIREVIKKDILELIGAITKQEKQDNE